MNLLIVEDEPRLRNALAHNIPWERHGIEVVGLASNGLEAMRLVEMKKPDMMLVDVQMPDMDGLTLVRKLNEQKELRALMKIIILSGHDNFAFAQEALEHGVSKYLLKPAGEDEILDAILEARQQLREELDQWQSKASLEQKWKDNLPHLQHSFFNNWVNDKYTYWEVLKKSKDLFIDLRENDQFGISVVDLDPISDQETRFGTNDRALLQFTIQCIARELLTPPCCWVCADSKYDLLLVFQMRSDEDPNEAMLLMNASIVKLLTQIREVLKLTASAGIGAAVGGISEISLLYSQACRALQERILFGHDIAIPYRKQLKRGDHALFMQSHREKTLEIALEMADESKALTALAEIWEEGASRSETADEVHEAVLYLSSLFVRIIQKQGWSVSHVVAEDIVYFHNVKLLNSKEQTWSWLMRTVKYIIICMQNQRKTASNQLVREMLTILDSEMDQEVTLHNVADRLYVNSSYLSRLFKQEMGVVFSVYVLERKMERAKEILQEGFKVYDAARMVGYRDVSYFTKVFRKYWGVNPSEMKS